MSDKSPSQTKPTAPENRDSTLRLLASMADTTWRMFTPPAILVPVGIFADLKLHTRPWLTFLSTGVGLSLSVLLVRKQLGKSE